MNLSTHGANALDFETPFFGTALGESRNALSIKWKEALAVQADERPRQNWIAQQNFDLLVYEWEQETFLCSNLEKMINNSAYQKVISMGGLAIPFLLREIQRNSYHWHSALVAITNFNPLPSSSDGDMDALRASWLAWGKSAGYSL